MMFAHKFVYESYFRFSLLLITDRYGIICQTNRVVEILHLGVHDIGGVFCVT
jgi:hypothetical protein